MHANVDQGVGQTPLTTAVIVLARALGQGLERCLHSRTADFVEHAVDVDHAIVAVGEGETARLHALGLIGSAAFGVARMARVIAGAVEAGIGLLARLAKKLGLVRGLPNRRWGAPVQ